MSFLSTLIFQTVVDADEIPMVEINDTEHSATSTVSIILIFGMGLNEGTKTNDIPCPRAQIKLFVEM